MRLQLGLPAFTSHDPRSGLVHFLFPGGFGHARLRHFFLDAGECRFAGFFFTLLLRHVPMPWVAVHFRMEQIGQFTNLSRFQNPFPEFWNRPG